MYETHLGGGSDPMLLLGVVLGTVAHAPLGFTVVAAAVIAVWLSVFALRERHARRH
jgi:hypothetical protein